MPAATNKVARRRIGTGTSSAGRGPSLLSALEHFETSLRAAKKSPKTITSYLDSARTLERWLEAQGRPNPPVDTITAAELRAYQADQLERYKPTTVRVRHASLGVLFRWLLEEEEIETNPMERVPRPAVVAETPRMLSDQQVQGLMSSLEPKRTRKGELTDFEGFRLRRDHAIVKLALNSGLRLAELAGLRVEDIDTHTGHATVQARKGGRRQVIPLGPDTCKVLDRYMRKRSDRPDADSPWLWLGRAGRFGSVGIAQMLRDRGNAAGIEGLHPHQLRHTWAHNRKKQGLSDGDLMVLGGWSDRSMIDRYGAAGAQERAIAAGKELEEL